MNCRDYEARCHDLLDARSSPAPGLERALESHAASCAHCRPIFLKYQTLRQAIAAWEAPVSPPAGLADRVLARLDEAPTRPLVFSLSGSFPRWAAAAAVVLAAGLATWATWRQRRGADVPPRPAVATRPLGEALADATSATLDLARATTGPAARIGRQVLDSADLPPAPWPSSMPAQGASGVLRSVSDEVNSGVRPLSGAARRAFGFLLPAPTREAGRSGA